MEELEFDAFLKSADEYYGTTSNIPLVPSITDQVISGESGSASDVGGGLYKSTLDPDYGFNFDLPDENEDVGGVSLLSNRGFSVDRESGGLLSNMISQPDQSLAATKGDDMAIKLASAAQASSGGDKGATDYLKLMASKLGDKTIAALIQAGFGMLQGASQGQMLQKKWDREDQIRNEEIARRAAYAKPGQVSQMQWSPSNPAGKGLLGAKVG